MEKTRWHDLVGIKFALRNKMVALASVTYWPLTWHFWPNKVGVCKQTRTPSYIVSSKHAIFRIATFSMLNQVQSHRMHGVALWQHRMLLRRAVDGRLETECPSTCGMIGGCLIRPPSRSLLHRASSYPKAQLSALLQMTWWVNGNMA